MGEVNIPNRLKGVEKEVFNDSYTAMWNLQQQTEKIVKNLKSQQAGQPEDVVKLLKEWIHALQYECKQFREKTDVGYQKVQSFFTPGEDRKIKNRLEH